jgi:hypothetical protein
VTRLNRPAPARRPGAFHFLDGLASIPVNPVTLASSGVLRATFDAIKDDPDVARSREAARGRDQDVIDAHAGAVARLAQRTAEYYAAKTASAFVKAPAPS